MASHNNSQADCAFIFLLLFVERDDAKNAMPLELSVVSAAENEGGQQHLPADGLFGVGNAFRPQQHTTIRRFDFTSI